MTTLQDLADWLKRHDCTLTLGCGHGGVWLASLAGGRGRYVGTGETAPAAIADVVEKHGKGER